MPGINYFRKYLGFARYLREAFGLQAVDGRALDEGHGQDAFGGELGDECRGLEERELGVALQQLLVLLELGGLQSVIALLREKGGRDREGGWPVCHASAQRRGGGVGTRPRCLMVCLWQCLLASRHCSF